MDLYEKGILLLATKNAYYGRMAHNLAVSIKATGTTLPVVVLTSGRGLSHLSDKQKEVFDRIMVIPSEGFAAKLHLYEYTPFTETLFLDADMAWLPKKKPEDLFEQMKGSIFQPIVEGYVDLVSGEQHNNPKYNIWADLNDIKKAFPLTEKLYQFRSEVLYFKKDVMTHKLFKTARKVHEAPGIEVNMFGGEVPDELAFNIAASMIGFEPTRTDFKPSWWFNMTKKTEPLPILADKYYLMSVGGNTANASVKKLYNTVMGAAFYKMRLQYLFLLQAKRDLIPERATI